MRSGQSEYLRFGIYQEALPDICLDAVSLEGVALMALNQNQSLENRLKPVKENGLANADTRYGSIWYPRMPF
jgi:hypothetical protein